MNKYSILALILACFGTLAKTQDTIYIHQHSGIITKIALSDIDSMVFYASSNEKIVLSDLDGNQYSTVKIGTQTWMAENLKTTKYNSGASIPIISDNTEWKNNATGAYCWYDNDSTNYSKPFGALYNWYVVETGNLCPTGWHVPSDLEWTTLIEYLGGESVAGGKLKETGTSHWLAPNEGATNETGFTAVPGSSRWYDGQFPSLGNKAYWWSSTENGACCAFNMYIPNEAGSAAIYDGDKESGASVRCLKD